MPPAPSLADFATQSTYFPLTSDETKTSLRLGRLDRIRSRTPSPSRSAGGLGLGIRLRSRSRSRAPTPPLPTSKYNNKHDSYRPRTPTTPTYTIKQYFLTPAPKLRPRGPRLSPWDFDHTLYPNLVRIPRPLPQIPSRANLFKPIPPPRDYDAEMHDISLKTKTNKKVVTVTVGGRSMSPSPLVRNENIRRRGTTKGDKGKSVVVRYVQDGELRRDVMNGTLRRRSDESWSNARTTTKTWPKRNSADTEIDEDEYERPHYDYRNRDRDLIREASVYSTLYSRQSRRPASLESYTSESSIDSSRLDRRTSDSTESKQNPNSISTFSRFFRSRSKPRSKSKIRSRDSGYNSPSTPLSPPDSAAADLPRSIRLLDDILDEVRDFGLWEETRKGRTDSAFSESGV